MPEVEPIGAEEVAKPGTMPGTVPSIKPNEIAGSVLVKPGLAKPGLAKPAANVNVPEEEHYD